MSIDNGNNQSPVERLDVIFENEKSKQVRQDPTTFLPEEPMVYEYKKKKKKKKHMEIEDPLKDLDKTGSDIIVKVEPDVTIKVENIEVEVDFQEFANGNGLMIDDGSQENIKQEGNDNGLVCLSFEETTDKSIFDYGPIGYRTVDTAPTFLCDLCHHVFNTARTLRIHKKRKHNSFRKAFKFICDDCGMSYEMKNSLLAHIKRKHGPDSVPEDKVERVCEICSLMFVGMNRLRMHMKRKHDSYFENFKHTCPVCNLSYDKNRSLVVHMQRKHNKSNKPPRQALYNCPFCPRLFTVRDTYMKHVKRKHQVSDEYNDYNTCPEKFLQTFAVKADGTGELACAQCSLVFADVTRLKIHMRRKHDAYQEFFGYKCTVCNLSYDKMASLKRHIRRKHDRGAYCELCQKQFDTRELYLNHSHEEKVLECDLCGLIFSNRRSYSKHMRCTHQVDSGMKSFFCTLCNDGFHEKRQLKLHLSQKHFKVCYTCVHCSKIFKAKESFRRHVLKKHPVEQANNEHLCIQCKESFPNEQELSKHIDIVHSKTVTQPPTTPVSEGPIDLRISEMPLEVGKVYQCPKCPAQFTEWPDLKHHNQEVHCPPEVKIECQCQMCGLVLPEVDLAKHMKKAHTEMELKCPHCDYETTHKANLTKHLLRHTNMSPLACDIEGCKFKTFYNSALQNHKIKHISGKDKIRLQCSKCPFQSMNKYTMKYHEEQHVTGKKKYSCDQCDYATILPANLIQHKYKHSPEKNFKCEVCSFATKYNASLRYHIKKKHCDLPVVNISE